MMLGTFPTFLTFLTRKSYVFEPPVGGAPYDGR